ncbi:distal tail protein Dit [Lacticaseibacillus paracasei]|uniref:distal tail protein Dit n=1 Tax=Lacticaseibacillus paracasei TaxID=1597 RepID=UPI0034E5297B
MTLAITFGDNNISKWLDGILLVTRNVGQNRVPQLDQVGNSDGKMLSYIRADEGTIVVTAIVRTNVTEKRRLLADALTTSTPTKLIFADEPDIYYNAISTGQITLDEAYLHNTLTITFTVPDGIAHSVATKTFDNMPYKDLPVNVLTDSGFESGQTPVNYVWGDGKDTDRVFQVVGQVSSFPTPFGNYMLEIGNWSTDSSTNPDQFVKISLSEPVYIKKGETWTYSYYYATAGSAVGQASDYVLTTEPDPLFALSMGHDARDASGGQTTWHRFVKTWTADRDITVTTLRFGFTKTSASAGWVCIDNIKLEQEPTVSPWSPNPADPEYYTDTITVHNGGTYPVEPVITATMHADNGMVGIVNDRPGILQFGTQEIDGYTTDVSEKGLNGNLSAPISGTIYNQSATNNPNWGGDSSKPNKQTGSINYVSDSYNGPHMEPAYASTGTYWNGPAAKIPIAATSQNTRNNNFTLTMMLHFETTVSELGRMELTLEAGGKVQYQMVVTDNNAVKDEIQVDCYVKDQQVGTMSLDRSKFTNDKLMQARLSKFGSSINFEVSPWNGKSGREMTVSLPPLTRPDMISENVEAFSVWFERNNTWGQSAMKLIAVQFDWQHVNWWTDIKNRFSNGDVLTIDVANAKTYLNGSENRTLHTIGNQWEQFKLPPGDTEITITPSSWAQPFACEVEIREVWL